MKFNQSITNKIFGIVITIILFFLVGSNNVLAVECSQVPPGGDATITTNCAFSGTVNGVDEGTGSEENTATLSVASQSTLTVGGLQTLAVGSLDLTQGGSIVIIDGGQIKIRTPIWMIDADADGIPESTLQIAQSTVPSDGQRRNTMSTITTIDSDPNTFCPESFDPTGSCNQCLNGSATAQQDGDDLFSECVGSYDFCDGAGSCSLHANRVFLTSGTYQASLGGLSGADSTCQSSANTASLGGNWAAWMSSTDTSAASRLSQPSQPYVLVDESTKIADNWNDLVDSTLDSAINKDEFGTTINGDNKVWTNTTTSGGIKFTNLIDTCINWKIILGVSSASIGLSSQTSGSWTDNTTGNCWDFNRLYCFEQ